MRVTGGRVWLALNSRINDGYRLTERDEGEDDGDDAFDGCGQMLASRCRSLSWGSPTKNHLPAVEAAKVIEGQDGRSEEAAKGTSQGGHDDVQGQTVDQLGAAVPSGHVVGDAGQHACLEDAEDEADAADLGLVGDEGGEDGHETEAETGQGNEPAGPHPLAEDVCWDLEDDVADVEDAEDNVVVEVDEAEVRLEACESGVA